MTRFSTEPVPPAHDPVDLSAYIPSGEDLLKIEDDELVDSNGVSHGEFRKN